MIKEEIMLKVQAGLEGVVVINKPQGLTSHDVVDRVRRKFQMKRIGHAGTLDPLATGVLVLLIGRGTKLFSKFEGFDKAYKATVILGTKTSTADIQGKIIEQRPFDQFTRKMVDEVLPEFVGEIEQIPPMVSAIKFKGKKLYELARKGIEVERQPRRIEIRKLEMEAFDLPLVKIYLECSKGTYVRQLAEDIGTRLGTVACIAEIQRTQVGPFHIQDALTLDELTPEHVRPWREQTAV